MIGLFNNLKEDKNSDCYHFEELKLFFQISFNSSLSTKSVNAIRDHFKQLSSMALKVKKEMPLENVDSNLLKSLSSLNPQYQLLQNCNCIWNANYIIPGNE